ncbi:sensor domain-containing diguanylate cyclase [Marinobacter halodurans]|uniref:diguanylate cyclase n=1 Tax=Marinobacter halodurans TaxID=2528979 RepID=A0ABY1ZKP2_9GAMM|nr:diguanylate cyclase [Marinobacter halodurans]TBW56171.1 sensor domain-containing diguanylate cyclase [Marinobacter halodurans]
MPLTSVFKDTSLSALSGVLPFVFANMDVAVIAADAEHRIAMVNRKACDMFGYDEVELVGQKARMLYADPADAIELQGTDSMDTDADPEDKTVVINYRRKSGQSFDGETLVAPIDSPERQNLLFLVFIRDVTHRLATEHTLSQLHTITTSRELGFEERIDAILRLGTEHFGLPIGVFSHIAGDTCTVMRVIDPDGVLKPGMTFRFAEIYCSHVYNVDDVRGFFHAGESEIRSHPCYINFQLEAYLGATIFVDGERYGTLNFSSPEPTTPFSNQDIELVRLFAQWVGHELARRADVQKLEEARLELEVRARTDALTGMFNRRYMEERLDAELDRSRRYGNTLAVVLLDFDHFKSINDQYGHAAGDVALELFADKVRELSRATDVTARWGGEEFLILMPETDLAGAWNFLERLADSLRTIGFTRKGQRITLTMSIGLAIARSDDDRDTVVNRADEAMYRAKSSGRNRICLAVGDEHYG